MAGGEGGGGVHVQIKKGKRVCGGGAKTLDGNGEIAIFGQAEEAAVRWGGSISFLFFPRRGADWTS